MCLRTVWFEIVGSEDAKHHGRGVDIAAAFFSDEAEASANRVRVADYFWRESGKWAQKNPPEGFGGMAYYGRWGGKQGFKPIITEAELSERVGLEIRRVMRRMKLGKQREVAKRYGRKMTPRQSRSRGRDGLTVFGVDGTKIGPVLIEWAERLAVDKEALASLADHQRRLRFRPQMLRALSELEVDPEPSPPNVDDDEGLPWYDEVDPDEAYLALLAADEEREALVEAEIDRLRLEADRKRRKEELREANRKRGARTTRDDSGARRRPSGR